MVTKDDKKLDAAAHVVSPYALIIELEGSLTGGRRMIFDVLKKLFKKEKLNLDEATFICHALGAAPLDAIPELIAVLDGEGVSVDKLQAAFLAALQSGDAELNLAPVLRKLLDTARAQGIPVVAASCLPAEVAEVVFGKSGLAEAGVTLHAVTGKSVCCPGRQDWQEISRGLSRLSRRCFAVVSTGAACHAALSVDLRVIAVCDEFTAAQDFGGAEAVYDSPADLDLADLIARMPAV